MTSNEQHFKRDAWLSGRHRTWGYNVPAMDVDFLMVEYDKCVPKAIIDYKHEHAILDLTNVGAKTLCNLGNMASIPAFIVQYGHSNQDGWWGEVAEDSIPFFVIWPLNEHAKTFMENKVEKVDEIGFVEFLYQLRDRKIPQDIVDIITKH
jgi:hypothetical protein